MKIVDENGKLFKKFNLVDAIVALLLVIIVVAVGWKVVSSVIASRQTDEEEITNTFDESPHLTYDVVCIDVPRKVAEAFEAEMKRPRSQRQLMSLGNALEGYITGCTFTPQDEDDSETALCTVLFTIECVPVLKDDIFSIGTQELRIGKPHIVKTYYIETSGWVYTMDIPEELYELEENEDA